MPRLFCLGPLVLPPPTQYGPWRLFLFSLPALPTLSLLSHLTLPLFCLPSRYFQTQMYVFSQCDCLSSLSSVNPPLCGCVCARTYAWMCPSPSFALFIGLEAAAGPDQTDVHWHQPLPDKRNTSSCLFFLFLSVKQWEDDVFDLTPSVVWQIII